MSIKSIKKKNGNLNSIMMIILFSVVLVLLTIFAISIGQVDIPYGDTFKILLYKISGIKLNGYDLVNSSYENIIYLIRLPRVLTACVVGAGLSLCGVIMQATVQNPLADPYVLGVSSGASLGATFITLIGASLLINIGSISISTAAFIGALFAMILVLLISNSKGRLTSTKLILSGTIINSMFSSFSSLILYFANNTQGLQNVTFWLMGSVSRTNWNTLPFLSLAIMTCSIYFYTQYRNLNVMLMGDEQALTLGINLSLYRRLYLIITSLITGLIVANTGVIGFVGLIIPHIARSLVGSDHKKLIPFSLLIGSIFMISTDLLARTIVNGTEIPVGIITSTIGAPIFLYILVKRNYGFGG